VEDSEMRHGRKSPSVLFDGYKRHVIRDQDTGLIPAAGITPANAPEASRVDKTLPTSFNSGISLQTLMTLLGTSPPR
jgi:hypothetical protein